MILCLRVLGIKSLIFPRAGNLISQSQNSNIFRIIIRFLFNKADVFLCQGEKWKKFAVNSLNINPNYTRIISNWSATDKLFKIGEDRIIKNKDEITEILYVGWLEKEKGIKELIEAVKTIYSNNKSVRLTLVGDGKIRKFVEEFTIKNRLNGVIQIQGWLSSKEIEKYLKRSNIFILPSWKEGMPNALIEALAAALPVITTSVGVINDYLVNNSSAIIIEPKEVNKITKSLEKLINDHNLRKKLSKNGFLVAKTSFSTETSLKKLSKIISEILN
jgi:glycosyltransferase involved in cell wall biosynthesis